MNKQSAALLAALERVASPASIEKYLFASLDNLRIVAGNSGRHDLARDIASLCFKHKLLPGEGQ